MRSFTLCAMVLQHRSGGFISFGGLHRPSPSESVPLCATASGRVLPHCRRTGRARAGRCKDERLLVPFLVAVSHIPLASLARWQPHPPRCSSSKPGAGAAWGLPPASGRHWGLRRLDKRSQGHGIQSRTVAIGIPSPLPISTCAAQRRQTWGFFSAAEAQEAVQGDECRS